MSQLLPTELFLYLLADAAGRSYELTNGAISKNNQPTWIDHAPQGWSQSGASFARNSTYYGINRSWSGDLKFTGTGAAILRHLFYTGKGVEEDLFLLVLKFDEQADTYKLYYRGEIDFSTWKDKAFDGVQVSVIEGGVLKALKANESTIYQYPCDGSIVENLQVTFDGYKFQDVFTYNIAAQQVTANAALACAFISNTGDNIGIQKGTQVGQQFSGAVITYIQSNLQNNIFSSLANTTVTATLLNLRLQKTVNAGVISTLKISLFDSLGNESPLLNQVVPANGLVSGSLPPTSAIADENGGLFLILTDDQGCGYTFINDTVQQNGNTVPTNQLTLSFGSKFQKTTAWGIPARKVLDLLMNSMTAGKYQAVSTLLDGLPNLVLVPGDALRAWTIPDGAIRQPVFLKTCFKDFWQWIDALQCCSLSNEIISGKEVLFLEKRGVAYDSSTVTMDLGEVSNLELDVAADHFCNIFEVGYPPQSYDQASGKLEFNTTSQFALPITRVQRKLSAISKYRADMFGIEFTRFNATGGASYTSNSSDNSIFVVDVNQGIVEYKSFDLIEFGSQNYSTSSPINFSALVGPYNDPVSGYFTADVGIANFTCHAAYVKVRLTLSLQISCPVSATMNILKNGVVIGSNPVTTNGITFNVLQAETELRAGDVISFSVVAGAAYTITGTGATIEMLAFASYALNRPAFDSITGLDNADTAYNITLSPKRMFKSWSGWLHSILHNQPTGIITYQTSDKNQQLTTKQGAEVIQESGDESVAGLNTPIVLPYLVTFNTEVPANFVELLYGVASGHIKFSYNGKSFYGFPQEVKQTPALNDAQQWKVLLSPATNLADFEDLDIDGLNFLNLMPNSTAIPRTGPVQFVPLASVLPAQYHHRSMDAFWFSEQIGRYVDGRNYFQKWQQNDIIELQFITDALGPLQVQLFDQYSNLIKTVALNTVTDPAILTPKILYMGAVTLNDVNEGIYYMILTGGTGGTITQHVSEPMYVKADHPDTLWIDYKHSKNKQSTIFSAGYTPGIRVEGYIGDFMPDANLAGYEDQPADFQIINGTPFRKYTLHIMGVPPWMIDKLNRIFSFDSVAVDGIGMARNSADSKFAVEDTSGTLLKYYTLEVRESENKDCDTLTTDGDLDSNLTVIYNIDTDGFGDGSSGTNIVEVVKIS